MATLLELRETNGGEVNANALGSRIRVFDVEGAPPEDIAWGVHGLPDRNEAHPDFPALLADRLSIVPGADRRLRTRVQVYYSNDRRWSAARPPDPADPAYIDYVVDSEIQVIDLPILKRVTKTAASGVGSVEVWELATKPVIERRPVFEIEVVTDLLTPDEVVDLILVQADTIHRFNNRDWLFQPGAWRRTDRNAGQVVYRWIGDEGTPGPPPVAANPRLVIPPSDGGTVNGRPMYRKPHHSIDYVTDSAETVGQAVNFPAFKRIDPTGYRSLPNIPLP